MLFNQIWRWYLRNTGNLSAIVLYAFVPGFVVILLRGTIADTLTRMYFLVLPLVIAERYWRRKPGTLPSNRRITYRRSISVNASASI